MGTSRFIDTNYKQTVDNLTQGVKDKLKNQFYTFTDKNVTIVDYYNIHLGLSTLDEASRLQYAQLGEDSPFRYNVIRDAYLLGIEKIVVSLNNDEWGLEADSIEGEGIVPPNTFIPYPDDFFVIQHVDQRYMFRVLSATPDTLEVGANFYKITYKLDQYNDDVIKNQVVEEYRMIYNNIGTQLKSVIRSTDYELIERLDTVSLTLKKYFKELFFKDRVQTFIFSHNGYLFYDPYMIEFIIRNDLLSGEEYTYVSHQTPVPETFSIDYNRTFFRVMELRDKKRIEQCNISSIALAVTDKNSLLSTRLEYYYKIQYTDSSYSIQEKLDNFDVYFIDKVKNNEYYEYNDIMAPFNIIIGYLNGKKINSKSIDIIELIDYLPSKDLFYAIPLIIYVIERDITAILSTTKNYQNNI